MKQINEEIPIYKKENKCYFILIEDMERLNKLVSPSYYKFINHLEYIPVFGLNLCKININSDRIPEGLIKILPISGLTPTIRESLSKCIKEYLGNCKFVNFIWKYVIDLDPDTVVFIRLIDFNFSTNLDNKLSIIRRSFRLLYDI